MELQGGGRAGWRTFSAGLKHQNSEFASRLWLVLAIESTTGHGEGKIMIVAAFSVLK